MKIKIAYCIPSLHWASGMERTLSLKANYFVEYLGYEVYVILTDGKDKRPFYQLSSHVNIVNLEINYDQLYGQNLWKRVFSYLYKQRIFKKRLSSCLKKIKPDITISTLRREINFINSINDGSIKIGEIHFSRANYRDLQYERIPNFVKKVIAKLWMRQLISKIKQLDRFVVLSHEDKEKWKEIDETNIEVIYNPLSFYPSEASSCNNKRVIAVGRYTYQKGFDLLIQAWNVIQQKCSGWELHIYGEGDRVLYQEQVEAKYLQDNCFLHPACSAIDEKYADSSILVFSSRYEGFGMVLAEAMACGVPPVSFACPCGPKDIITHGQDGLLVENGNVSMLADKISYLIENEDIRKQLGRNARQSAQQFKIELIAQQWKNLFEELLRKKRPQTTC